MIHLGGKEGDGKSGPLDAGRQDICGDTDGLGSIWRLYGRQKCGHPNRPDFLDGYRMS